MLQKMENSTLGDDDSTPIVVLVKALVLELDSAQSVIYD